MTQKLLSFKKESVSSTTEEEVLVSELIQVITYHNQLYHVEAVPVISDVEYDYLFAWLQDLEKKYPELIASDSPTQKLHVQIQNGFIKKDHGGHRLLSLKNSYNAEDLREWDTFIKKQIDKDMIYTFVIEPKFDGSAVHIIYKYGHLIHAITRGDGLIGEDITEHIKAVANLPLFLPSASDIAELRLRAEIVMPKHTFAKINEEQVEEGLPVFANTRNATAGTLRQLDPWMVRKRGLILFIHDLIYWTYSDVSLVSDTQVKALLQSRGLPLFHRSKKITTIDEVISLCTDVDTKNYLDNEKIDFDGLVVKIDELTLREQLGTTDHHPRWAMAYKFPAQQIVTKLEDVTYQIGRTGVITPVAELRPIQLSGATISRATLHNFDYIQKYDIRKGDMVWVQRSGEVIPYIVGPVIQQRMGDEIIIEVPQTCPSCDTCLVRKEGEVAWLCPNTMDCLSQRKERIKHFVSKHCMNIVGMGNALVDMLVEQKLIEQRPDIWRLTDKNTILMLRGLPGIAGKKLQQLTIELEKAKKVPLWRLLHALGIPYVGKKISRVLEEHIVSLHTKDLLDIASLSNYLTDRDALQDIYGLGPQSIDALVDYFLDDFFCGLLQQANELGLVIDISPQDLTNGKSLVGEKIVITGTFNLPREMIIETLEQHGADVVTTVSSKTTLLLLGDTPGSKYAKAQKLGISLISFDELCNLFNISQPTNIASKEEKKTYETPSLFG